MVTLDTRGSIEAVVSAARQERSDITIVARARDAKHATELYEIGVDDAVPETIEASLQLSEAVLADIGIPMGLVIASIHERRDEFRAILRTSNRRRDPSRTEFRARRTVGKTAAGSAGHRRSTSRRGKITGRRIASLLTLRNDTRHWCDVSEFLHRAARRQGACLAARIPDAARRARSGSRRQESGRFLLPVAGLPREGRAPLRPLRSGLRAHAFRVWRLSAKGLDSAEIPDEWLRKLAERYLSEEEKREIEALGWDKLFETLKKRLAEQKERHQGGNKWIGTGGTSPYGAHGYNPEGIRIGQEKNRNFRAVKVWDKREFKDFDDSVELGVRNMRVALRRLRRFARSGAVEELDLDGTIHETAHKGYLDVKLRPERRNAVKVLLFLDVGGSMDWHIQIAEELFSAARLEFKHFEHFYFHNCVYEKVWKDNRRRFDETIPTLDVIRTYSSDYRVVIVSDASMSPYEILMPGGSVEHWNEEPGQVWMERLLRHFNKAVLLNPVPTDAMGATPSRSRYYANFWPAACSP